MSITIRDICKCPQTRNIYACLVINGAHCDFTFFVDIVDDDRSDVIVVISDDDAFSRTFRGNPDVRVRIYKSIKMYYEGQHIALPMEVGDGY